MAGCRRFKEELLQSFPHGGQQIDAYLQHIRAATNSLQTHIGKRYLPASLQTLAGRFGSSYFSRTTKAVMADFVQDPKLASVLCGQWGDYGLPPAQSSFAITYQAIDSQSGAIGSLIWVTHQPAGDCDYRVR